jgi:four helix bundle protein
LDVVPQSEELAVMVYAATRAFPADERFGLTAQTRRASVSVGSNVVEGCNRQGNRAFLAFLHNALGSAGELEFQLRLALRLSFGDPNEVRQVLDQANKVKRMLIRLIESLRERTK